MASKETRIEVGGQTVSVLTQKDDGRGGVFTCIQVIHLKDDAMIGQVMTFEIFGDFRQVLIRDPKVRATQKNIDAQHAIALEKAKDLDGTIRAFYEAKALEAAAAE